MNVQHPLGNRVTRKRYIYVKCRVIKTSHNKRGQETSTQMTRHDGGSEFIKFFLWWRHIISNKSSVKTIMMILNRENQKKAKRSKHRKRKIFLLLMFLLFLSSTFDGLLAGVWRSFLSSSFDFSSSRQSAIVLIECVAKHTKKERKEKLFRNRHDPHGFFFPPLHLLFAKKIKIKVQDT